LQNRHQVLPCAPVSTGRSFRLNDEANLNVYDSAMATRQTKVFEDDLERSRRVTYDDWTHRPFKEKAMDWIASAFRLQL
jgi:cardiolipin synthase A/B